MLFLCFCLTTFSPDDPKNQAAADTPAKAIERYAAAIREGEEKALRLILGKETMKSFNGYLASAVEQQRLEQTFTEALIERFGKEDNPKPRPPAPSLSKDPQYAAKIVHEERVNAERVKLMVLSGQKLPSGEIDGKEVQMVAVLEDSTWKLDLPQVRDLVAAQAFVQDLMESMTEQKQKVLEALKEGKFTTREEARKAWNAVIPTFRKDLPGRLKIPPPGDIVLPKPMVRRPGPPLPVPPRDRQRVELRRAESRAGAGLNKMYVAGTEEELFVHAAAELTTDDIAAAKVVPDASGTPVLELTFNPKGVEKLTKLAKDHAGKPVAFVVNGKVLAAAKVLEKAERMVLSVVWTERDLKKLAAGINGNP